MNSKRKEKYTIESSLRFSRDLQKIPKPSLEKIIPIINDLEASPFAGKRLHGQLDGLYSLRVGVYRIIYVVYPSDHIISLLSIKHRKKVYER